jgi:hypothetical protein
MLSNVNTLESMSPEARTEHFLLRISPTERAMLDALADKAGLSASDIVRTLIRGDYQEKFGDKPPKKPKQK